MKRVAAIALIALAGVATAALLAASSAQAWDVNNLPPGCTQDGTLYDSSGPNWSYWIKCGSQRTLIHYGSQPIPAAPTDGSFQGNLDAFVDANYTAPATTQAAPTTTAAPAAPPVTTTVTQTVTQPASGTTPATTTTVVVVTTVSPVEKSLQDQIDALTAQIKALTDRVTRLEKAGDAAWLTFQQAVSQGADTAIAAAMAHQTWVDVVGQTGAYAPPA